MKKFTTLFLALLIAVFSASTASATIDLYDWAFYVDGTTYENFAGDSMPTTGTLTNDLGTLTWSTSIAGSHTFIAFFDYEIDEPANTFFNEYGAANGTPAASQSWEIDEPGYVFGDIYDHVTDPLTWGFLDNTNGVPSSAPDDVSMAMGWNFDLLATETATISLILSDSTPASGFYLSHTDPESNDATIYFSSTLDIRGGQDVIPEPGTMLLLGTGLAGLAGLRKKRSKK